MKNNIKKIDNIALKDYCSFKIGGIGKCLFLPKNLKELISLMNFLIKEDEPYFILGNGTNVLFDDHGYRGSLISLKYFNSIEKIGDEIICGAGVKLFQLCSFCVDNCLEGFEFLYGIPGTVGGAVFMNAGAFGDEICNYLSEMTVIKEGKKINIKNFNFSYRKGPVDDNCVITNVKFKLKLGDRNRIILNQKQILERRKNTQPYGQPSAGSIFKRQHDVIPAKLIDSWGLKGLKIGGAMISCKHAGFIVNNGQAKAEDVKLLIEIIKYIARLHGYNFELEIKIL